MVKTHVPLLKVIDIGVYRWSAWTVGECTNTGPRHIKDVSVLYGLHVVLPQLVVASDRLSLTWVSTGLGV